MLIRRRLAHHPVRSTWLTKANLDRDAALLLKSARGFGIRPVPPQNPVDRTIVDVSALGAKLAYPDGRRAASSLHATRSLSESLIPHDVGREPKLRAVGGPNPAASPHSRMASRRQPA